MSADSDRTGEPAVKAITERRLMGSLRDALAAAGTPSKPPVVMPPPLPAPVVPAPTNEVKAGSVRIPDRGDVGGLDTDAPHTKMVRQARPAPAAASGRTQLIRGRNTVKKTDFHQDPVVGWLVIVGGLGLGAFRPVFEGNNSIGRAKSQRIPIDFGDETISSEEQAFIRYDSVDRTFLLVPNLAKTNIVAVNDRKPTGAIELAAMDLITMGRTQLVFVPFCGQDFDWAELSETKG